MNKAINSHRSTLPSTSLSYINPTQLKQSFILLLLLCSLNAPLYAAKESHKKFALHRACQSGNIEAVKNLLEDPNIEVNQEDKKGRTPLYIACENNQIEIVALLLNDKRVNPTPHGYNLKTPHQIAHQKNYKEILKLFRELKGIAS